MDGVNLRPVLEETGDLERDTIYCHFPHTIPATKTPASVYAHQRNWKLIRFFADNEDQTDRFELYDLAKDIGETNNLAAQMPDKVRELNMLITQKTARWFAPGNLAGQAKNKNLSSFASSILRTA